MNSFRRGLKLSLYVLRNNSNNYNNNNNNIANIYRLLATCRLCSESLCVFAYLVFTKLYEKIP